MLTENAASSQRSLHWLVRLVLLIAANDAALHVMIFQHEAEQFEPMPPLTAAIAELCITSAARHMITALRSLDVNLNHIQQSAAILGLSLKPCEVSGKCA